MKIFSLLISIEKMICIPYRFNADQSNHDKCVQSLEVLVVKSQKSDRVLFPKNFVNAHCNVNLLQLKGGWEKDETVEDAARREAMEEAGVEGLMEVNLMKSHLFFSVISNQFHEIRC
ncbi:Nudix hydrolase 17 [Nymphaea thermarum]|nr:Nudix hydrolase 17 [Nymphaea thermarum]